METSTTRPPVTFSASEAPRLVVQLYHAEVPFGLAYYPDKQKVALSVCQPSQLVKHSDPSKLFHWERESGFVAIPFDTRLSFSFFIPNTWDGGELPISTSGQRPNPSVKAIPKEQYKNHVSDAVQAIATGMFTKLVVSRCASDLFDSKELLSVVGNLFSFYPKAHITIFFLPEMGLWLSASPEILVEKESKNLLKTMALAGTMPYYGQELKSQGWTEKEIEEQALVSDFVKEKLTEAGFFLFQQSGPATIEAGNLLHLRTDFLVAAPEPEHFQKLVSALHPTSAVCGSPRESALDWLAENEGFDRKFYAGCAGMISSEGSKMVVLLRAACVTFNQITLYAGAGITQASIPEKEWAETEEKLKTFRRILPQNQPTA